MPTRKRQLAEHKISFKRMSEKFGKWNREAGEVRLEVHAADNKAFSSMIDWKRKQYHTTGVTDVLAVDWTVALLQRILTCKEEPFSGILSALYIDNILAAVLLSMKSYGVLHGWFSAYSPSFAQFSPGLILWSRVGQGRRKMGDQPHRPGQRTGRLQKHIMSDSIAVAEGSVDTRPLGRIIRRHWHRPFIGFATRPCARPLLTPGRFVRRIIETNKLK